jgi:hypothetical protein
MVTSKNSVTFLVGKWLAGMGEVDLGSACQRADVVIFQWLHRDGCYI